MEKNIALTAWTFVGKVLSLLFNMSRFVIAFLQRRQYIFISWLQSPSAVILEPKKIKSGMHTLFPLLLAITNSQSLLKLMSIESVMPSNHLILCYPLLLPSIFPSIRIFSNKLVLSIRWPKYWSFSISISPSNEYSGLILVGSPCCPRDSQESSPTPWFKRISAPALSFLYSPTLTSIHGY